MKHSSSLFNTHLNKQEGFTLVELVVTLALAAILVALAMPDFGETLRSWRRDSATRALTSSLHLARTEAIKSSRRIMVCPSSNGTSCTATTEWRNGWMVFVDDGATDQAFDAGERILQVTTAPGGIASLTSSGGMTFLQFFPTSLMAPGSTAGATTGATTFTVTPSGATSATLVNKITVSRVGRATVATAHP